MRLKVLFAPLSFLVAIVISIWYIWPAIQDIQTKGEEIKTSKDALNFTLDKKGNIKALEESLNKNKDKEDFILSFLPLRKNEEKIIDGLNYLATDSGLSVVSISTEEEKEAAIQPAPVAAASLESNLSATDASSVAAESLATSAPKPPAKIKIVNVKISLVGKYNNIKMFLNQIHKMELFNEVISLSITKPTESASEGEQASGDTLLADVEMKFGFLPAIKVAAGESSPVFSQRDFNFNSYSTIKEMITEKIPLLEEGQKGKNNPFFP